jgi:ATP-dependent RNA helicase RhlE
MQQQLQNRESRFAPRHPSRFGGNPSGNSRFGNRSGGSRFGGRGRMSSAPKHKYLDPMLFVKKAEETVEEEVYVPENSFASFQFVEPLYKNIERRGYTTPTLIQDKAIPHLIAGKDVIGLANTGTGKTAAFLIPLIDKVYTDRSQNVLIVAPTRELAVQIEQELRLFSDGMKLYSALCIGGVNIYRQIERLRRNPHFVIGTPGRLRDLERQNILHFEDFNNIVLDEVDQMLDMGFINDVKYITSRLPEVRQSLFFSATLSDEIQHVMRGFLNDPIKISVKSRETSANVDQDIIRTQGRPKIDILHEMLGKEEFDKVLIFSRTKRGAEKLAQMLYDRRVDVVTIHGNKSQNQRQRAIDLFKKNHVKVLIATDVASRGLDIDNITHVINFDIPETYEDYVHRIGRTGRANKKGIALTFVD